MTLIRHQFFLSLLLITLQINPLYVRALSPISITHSASVNMGNPDNRIWREQFRTLEVQGLSLEPLRQIWQENVVLPPGGLSSSRFYGIPHDIEYVEDHVRFVLDELKRQGITSGIIGIEDSQHAFTVHQRSGEPGYFNHFVRLIEDDPHSDFTIIFLERGRIVAHAIQLNNVLVDTHEALHIAQNSSEFPIHHVRTIIAEVDYMTSPNSILNGDDFYLDDLRAIEKDPSPTALEAYQEKLTQRFKILHFYRSMLMLAEAARVNQETPLRALISGTSHTLDFMLATDSPTYLILDKQGRIKNELDLADLGKKFEILLGDIEQFNSPNTSSPLFHKDAHQFLQEIRQQISALMDTTVHSKADADDNRQRDVMELETHLAQTGWEPEQIESIISELETVNVHYVDAAKFELSSFDIIPLITNLSESNPDNFIKSWNKLTEFVNAAVQHNTNHPKSRFLNFELKQIINSFARFHDSSVFQKALSMTTRLIQSDTIPSNTIWAILDMLSFIRRSGEQSEYETPTNGWGDIDLRNDPHQVNTIIETILNISGKASPLSALNQFEAGLFGDTVTIQTEQRPDQGQASSPKLWQRLKGWFNRAA